MLKESVASVSVIERYEPTAAAQHAARIKLQTANYNFALDGATTAGDDFSLPLAYPIPAGSVVTRIFVTNTAASVGPTNLGLGIVAANDLIASTAISGAPWTLGTYEATVVNAPLTTVASDASALLLTPTVAAHSAGDITFAVEYLEPSTGSELR